VRVIRAPLIPRGSGGRPGLILNFFSFALFGSLLAQFRCKGVFDAILVYEPSSVTAGLPVPVCSGRMTRTPLTLQMRPTARESKNRNMLAKCHSR
jgi:hypothetical protein